MSENKPETGTINWIDLTVPNADEVRDFYQKVVGWTYEPVSMGNYNDYNMNAPESGTCITGICHARGANTGLPAQWLIYINVANIDESIKNCRSAGGKIIQEIRNLPGHGKYCVIEDPAGAVAALFEPEEK